MLVALAVAMTCCPHDDAGAASADEHHGTSAAECAEAGAAPNAASPSEERGIEGIAQETERRFVAACAALARHGGQAAGRSAAAEVFLPRFLALAQQGSLNAILWCLEHQSVWSRERGITPSACALRRALWLEVLQRAPRMEAELEERDVMGWLARETILPSDEAVALAADFAALASRTRLRAAAVYARGRLTAPWDTEEPERIQSALVLLERVGALVREDDPIAAAARDASFRLQNLSIGCRAPEFATEDARGNEIRLDDLRGKTVLVRFWSSEDEDGWSRMGADGKRVRKFWDASFVLVGVNGDPDSREFLQRFEDLDVRWPHAWEASHRGSAGTAWHLGSAATILLDEKGIVRHVDLEGEALDAAIESLVLARERRVGANVGNRNNGAAGDPRR